MQSFSTGWPDGGVPRLDPVGFLGGLEAPRSETLDCSRLGLARSWISRT